jgi:lipopolysaccharide export system permease protein
MIYRRHLLFQMMGTALGSVGFFVGVLLAGNVIRDVLRLVAAGQMDGPLFLRTLMTLVPSVVAYALPLGMLTAVLLVVGRMSAENELLILQNSGLSLIRITAPILWLAILGALLSAAINFFYAPRALYQYRHSLRTLIQRNPLQFIQPNRFIRDFPGYIFYAGGREGRTLRRVYVWELDQDRRLSGFLYADRGIFSPDDGGGEGLLMELRDGHFEHRGTANHLPSLYFKEFTVNCPVRQIFQRENPGEKPLKHRDLGELLRSLRDGPADPDFPEKRSNFIRVNFIIQQRLSMAVSVLTLSLLAIPLALATRRKETSINTVLALSIALCYYFTTIVISWFQDSPFLRADWLIWFPNSLILGLGLFCFIRS